MEKIKVLLADDMEIISQMLQKTLTKRDDIEVIYMAKDGEEEYNKIIELQPDLVFTDNQMPKMNGIDVIEKIYNSDMNNKPKFVLVTGDRDYALFNRAYSSGTILVINKPVDDRKIIEAVDEYIVIKEEENNSKHLNEKEKNKNEEKINKSFFSKLKELLKK